MHINKFVSILSFGLLSVLFSCTEVKEWNDPTDQVPPGSVTNVIVKNLNGGALITYQLPSDNDLLGVKAVYSFGTENDLREAYASAFTDTIILQGYSDTLEHVVKLYSVDKSMNESQPVDVAIQPLTPPIELIRESLKINPTFGGIYLEWENIMKEEIAVTVSVEDSLGEMTPYDVYYSQTESGKYSFRGFENEESKFRIDMRDRWNNYSTPLDTVLTPLFEEQIVGRTDNEGNIWVRYGWADKSSLYRGDISTDRGGSMGFDKIFDGIEFNSSNWWHTGDNGNYLQQFVPDWPDANYFAMPIYLTIDMGKMASYSRLRYWIRNRTPLFSVPVITSLEVWATNNPKPITQIGDGSREANLKYWTQWEEVGGTDQWKEDWNKLADCVLELPSGETDPNKLTNEDQEFIKAGFEFEMDPLFANTPFRYIRLVIRKQNQATSQIQLGELKFWGAYAK